MDENMLTGEAVPVRKVSYSPAVDGLSYDPDVLKSCTLYGGTSVAQVGRTDSSWRAVCFGEGRSPKLAPAYTLEACAAPAVPSPPRPVACSCLRLPVPPQVRPGGTERVALGVVCRTAFWTAKGQLMKSILFPRQHRQTFVGDALKFIAVMMMLGLLFYVWDVVALASYGAHAG